MKGIVLSNLEVKKGYFCLKVKSPGIAAKAKAGQFGMIEVSKGYDPLLKRPMSFHRIDKKEGVVEFLYHVTGKGTTLISRFARGHEVEILGPIGSGFKIKRKKNIYIVAGGIGVSPMMALAEEIISRGIENNRVTILIGGRSSKDILSVPIFKRLGIKVKITTEDGSTGNRGLITKALESTLSMPLNSGSGIIYTCGPHAMLKAVHNIAVAFSVECQVSMENLMACGTGACLGCVVKIKNGDDGMYKTVCKDGPVFESSIIDW